MFSDPRKNIEALGLLPGMAVADFGAGSGHYSLEASRSVKDVGRVYAIDIQKDLATRIKNEARSQHLMNVEALWGDIEELGGSKLRDSSIDAVILANILFQVGDKDAVLEEARRVLKPKGRILIVDWLDSFGGIGPHSDSVFGKSAAEALIAKHSFLKDKEMNAGQHHYSIVAIKQ
jgi:ubiquinone/menaquinone biosynthesis C-methylase UbiE